MVVHYLADALWSLNERAAGREGLEMERLDLDWLNDPVALLGMEAEHIEAAKEELLGPLCGHPGAWHRGDDWPS